QWKTPQGRWSSQSGQGRSLAEPRSHAQVRAAAGDAHQLLVPFAAGAAGELEVVADGGDAHKHVWDVACDADGGKKLTRKPAIPDLLAVVGGDLDAPAHGILHATLGLAQIDSPLDAGDNVCGGRGAAAEVSVAHAGVDLAGEVLTAAVGGAGARGKGSGGEVADGRDEDAVAQD